MRSIGEDAWRAVSGAVNDAFGAIGEFVSDNQADICAADAGLVGAMIAGISILRGNDLATTTSAGMAIADQLIL